MIFSLNFFTSMSTCQNYFIVGFFFLIYFLQNYMLFLSFSLVITVEVFLVKKNVGHRLRLVYKLLFLILIYPELSVFAAKYLKDYFLFYITRIGNRQNFKNYSQLLVSRTNHEWHFKTLIFTTLVAIKLVTYRHLDIYFFSLFFSYLIDWMLMLGSDTLS